MAGLDIAEGVRGDRTDRSPINLHVRDAVARCRGYAEGLAGAVADRHAGYRCRSAARHVYLAGGQCRDRAAASCCRRYQVGSRRGRERLARLVGVGAFHPRAVVRGDREIVGAAVGQIGQRVARRFADVHFLVVNARGGADVQLVAGEAGDGGAVGMGGRRGPGQAGLGCLCGEGADMKRCRHGQQ